MYFDLNSREFIEKIVDKICDTILLSEALKSENLNIREYSFNKIKDKLEN
jgi:hypothetical protein